MPASRGPLIIALFLAVASACDTGASEEGALVNAHSHIHSQQAEHSRQLHAADATQMSSDARGNRCVARHPSAIRQASSEMRLSSAAKQLAQLRLGGTMEMDIRFTVFTTVSTPTLNTSNVPDSIITQQVADLNAFYAPYGFHWNLVGIQRVRSRSCENINLIQDGGVRDGTQTRQYACQLGAKLKPYSPMVMDVYTRNMVDDAEGLSSFPSEYTNSPQMKGGPVFDGIMLAWITMRDAYTPGPDSNLPPFAGHTLCHEAGHWLSLYHPFEGGCDYAGDWVSDTPPQQSSYTDCKARVSCGGAPGMVWKGKLGYKDLVHNIMNYGDDTCSRDFTQGQVNRMQYAWAAYRSSPAALTIEPVAASCASAITFDTVSAPSDGSLVSLPDGFQRLSWGTFSVANSNAIASAYGQLVAENSAPQTEAGVDPHQLLATGYIFGVVSEPNILVNADGAAASISASSPGSSFTLGSFYATPVYVDTLTLTLTGTTTDGSALSATFTIVNPQRTQVVPDSSWTKLSQVTFTSKRADFPQDATVNHAMAIDDMCITVTGSSPSPKSPSPKHRPSPSPSPTPLPAPSPPQNSPSPSPLSPSTSPPLPSPSPIASTPPVALAPAPAPVHVPPPPPVVLARAPALARTTPSHTLAPVSPPGPAPVPAPPLVTVAAPTPAPSGAATAASSAHLLSSVLGGVALLMLA